MLLSDSVHHYEYDTYLIEGEIEKATDIADELRTCGEDQAGAEQRSGHGPLRSNARTSECPRCPADSRGARIRILRSSDPQLISLSRFPRATSRLV